MENVEGIDLAKALTDYSWNQYAYNAALKVGTSILSASFIDFMK
jgi:flagellar hook-associated protein 3 FlgL